MKTLSIVFLSALILTLCVSFAVNTSYAQSKKEAIVQSKERVSKVPNVERGTLSSFSVSNSSSDTLFYVGDDGRVGIGTTNPIRNLHIREDKNGVVGLDIGNLSTGAASRERLSFNNEDGTVAGIQVSQSPNDMSIFNNRPGGSIGLITGGITVPRLTVTNTGNVGIGLTSPDEKLHVEGTIEVDQKIQANDAGGLELATDEGTTRLFIADNGRVGIGTTSPQSGLHIHPSFGLDASSLGLTSPSSGAGSMDGLRIRQIGSFASILNMENGPLSFATNLANVGFSAAIRMTIGALGNVGIGTTEPSEKLEIGNGGKLRINDTGNNIFTTFEHVDNNNFRIQTSSGGIFFNTGGTDDVFIKDNGRVGIGTTSPNYKLDVRGNIGNNTTLHHSDIRWKKNVKSLPNSLQKVIGLRGVNFEWRRDEFADMNFPAGKRIGLIAQEVEEVIPELVNTAVDGYKSVEYANLVAVLIEAVKEQQKIIDEQNSKIAAIEARIGNDEYTLNNSNQ